MISREQIESELTIAADEAEGFYKRDAERLSTRTNALLANAIAVLLDIRDVLVSIDSKTERE